MVLRAVHVAEGERHHLLDDLDRIARCAIQAQAEDRVDSGGVAFVADIMAVHAPCLAVFLCMANGALHDFVCFQIDEGRFADQAFVFHTVTSIIYAGEMGFNISICITAGDHNAYRLSHTDI